MTETLRRKLKKVSLDAARIAKLNYGEDMIMFRLERLADHIDRITEELYAAKRAKERE